MQVLDNSSNKLSCSSLSKSESQQKAATPCIAVTERRTGRWQLAFNCLFLCFTHVATWPVA